MKKFLLTLLAILLVFAAAAGIGYGAAWYRCNHVFVGGEAYPIDSESLDLRDVDLSMEDFVQLSAQLPNCDIQWSVPFQGGRYPNDTQLLPVKELTEEDVYLIAVLFPELQTLDASACCNYDMLEMFAKLRPNCVIVSRVDLGGSEADTETTTLTLQNGEYTFDALMENLVHLEKLENVTFHMPELTLQQLDTLKETYENVVFQCTVEILGTEYDTETTKIDLSAMDAQQIPLVGEKLGMLHKLELVELMGTDGQAKLTVEEVKQLQALAPQVAFNYTFEFFGTTISTADREVIITERGITDADEAKVRAALDLMTGCERFVLDGCQMSDKLLAEIREDYRGKANLVWRIHFGDNGSALTDHEVIMCSGTLNDSNCAELVYCEGARFVDLGHNDYLTKTDFIAGMTNLEAIILSGSSITDLTPFKNCKKLEFLEVAFCSYITDLSPLAECENLKMLNIGYTGVTDLSPLDNLPMTHLSAKRPSPKISAAERARFDSLKPDCWTEYIGSQPYGVGWRYDSNNTDYLPYYAMLRVIFKYPAPDSGIKVGPNKRGWYLKDCDLSQWNLTEKE